MDTLEAEIMLCQLVLQGPWKKQLGEVLDFARMLLRCEVLEESVKQERLCGLTAHELRERSHRPQDFYGQMHFMPSASDTEAVLRLNRLRTLVRATELKAVAALPERTDILRAFNRMSSYLYILMIREKATNTR
jgi:ethanolamine utilization cobalamin adenosyltransferase